MILFYFSSKTRQCETIKVSDSFDPVYLFSGFIIDEAEVDDEVDEDEEWEDGANEIGIVNEVDEIGPTAREIEIRRRGNLWE